MKVSGQIELLIKQREKVDQKDFDLEAWKSTATALISKIFGKRDPRVQTILNLKIDYGSWALRDASSTYDPVATCKNIARDVMDMSIDELKAEERDDQSDAFTILNNHLTGTQMRDIQAILSIKNKKILKTDLAAKLQSLKAPLLAKILGDLLEADKK